MVENERDDAGRRSAPPPCERCGCSSWVPIMYGFPDEAGVAAATAGEIDLGGCVIEDGAPNRRCRICSHRPGIEMDWTGEHGPSSGEFAIDAPPLRHTSIPGPGAGELEMIEFALSFDAYAALGPDTVQSLGARARRHYGRSGQVADNLVLLRANLFFEQRASRFTDSPLDTPYVRALIGETADHASRERR